MKIFIDFDDVLFNTRKFRDDLKMVFLRNGISGRIFQKYYYDYPFKKSNGGLAKYDLGEHVRRIKKLGINIRGLEKDLIEFMHRVSKYVFYDATFFLKNFSRKDLCLVSYAKTRFQVAKIRNSGLAKFFRRIVIIDALKSKALKEIIEKDRLTKKDKLYFIDDRIEQIDDAKRKFPWVTTIFVRRREGRYRDKANKNCDFKARNLKEAWKIISLDKD